MSGRARAWLRFLVLTTGFFLLYALTAQRSLGWSDSGELQLRVLSDAAVSTGSLATDHPLYLAFCRCFCSTPFAVTLVSSLFGALAVGGFLLASRNLALSLLFGLSHMLWWLSCVTEVQTTSLALTAFETAALLRFLTRGGGGWLVTAAALNGVHLGVHNLALLALPVFLALGLWGVRRQRLGPATLVWALAVWLAAAAVPLVGAFKMVAAGGFSSSSLVRGLLVGDYGEKVFALWPENGVLAAFNLALASLTFFPPVLLWHWSRRRGTMVAARPESRPERILLVALFAVNALFWIRYFVPDQATFALPTAFFAWLLVARLELRRERAVALALMQVLLPILAWLALSQLKVPSWRPAHPFRDEARYFALPWKCGDYSADRAAALQGGEWNGYPADCHERSAQ